MSLKEEGLKKLNIKSEDDLLRYFPIRYGSVAKATTIDKLIDGEKSVIFGRIRSIKTKKAFRSKVPMAEAIIEDDTGTLKTVWFSQAYIAKMYSKNSLVRLEGEFKKGSMVNPHIETVSKVPNGVGDSLFGESTDDHHLYPVYKESKGVTSNWIYHALQKVFASEEFVRITDPLPTEILTKYNLPTLQTAYIWIHSPKKEADAISARKRFAFEEIFLIQLQKNLARKKIGDEKPFVIDIEDPTIDEFTNRFPFQLTDGQKQSIQDIRDDFRSGRPMSRLLEGDVGSGKTAIAAVTAYATVKTRPLGSDRTKRQNFGHLQIAYMVPTEILAKQHFESFIKYFSHLPINIGLIIGSECRKFPSKVSYNFRTGNGSTHISKATLLKWIENGEVPIVIGTHALIQKSVKFKHLAYVIIDEQHRFGTAQRRKLAQKNKTEDGNIMPHLLSMTATPIPRTLALTLYGDLDLSVLEQMPVGRKRVITEIILPKDRENAYKQIREEIRSGHQAYVICPRIDEPDPDKERSINAVSVVAEAKRLQSDIFPDFEIDIMHGKMNPKDKDAVMKRFADGRIDILVSTSVIEVGVNVPNATVILIEGADRFGLSQLHQLRGRVIRSSDQAYCFVCTESTNEKTVERLEALKTAKSGFELAEKDLKLRGSGSLAGNKQWGLSDIAMDALQNLKLVEAARSEAKKLIDRDPDLATYPILSKLLSKMEEIHFE